MTDNPAPSLLELYLRDRAMLVRFFTARTGSAAEAEDLVQEIYLKIRQINGCEAANSAAYLYRLGMNLLVDRYRSQSRARLRERRYVEASVSLSGAVGVCDAPSAEEAIDARARLNRLLEAAAQLPLQRRRVFRMHKLEGKSHEEVAQALGISRSAVEKHIIAALRQLAAYRDS